jgi:hypothetical protein
VTQLIIQYNQYGEWRAKYIGFRFKNYINLSLPKCFLGQDRYLGVIVDNRDKWRKKLDLITQNASYEIILKGGAS